MARCSPRLRLRTRGDDRKAGGARSRAVAAVHPARCADPRDRDDYQTVYAARPGAVAAPTAGLHFTPALMASPSAGIGRQHAVTLHVGAGTFLPVAADDTEDHVMHAERGEIGDGAAEAIRATRAAGGRVVAVGTTSLRLLETAAADRASRALSGQTAHLHHAGLPLQGRGPAAHQFPPAPLDALHAGLRLRRHGPHERGLCPRHGSGLPLLLLRRRLSVGHARKSYDLVTVSHSASDRAARAGAVEVAHGQVSNAGLHAGRDRGDGQGA